jgi:hypothetical protein
VRTTKPIAAISYNTPAYLEQKLRELTTAKIISVWHFICHLPEDDEGGKKNHIHLYIEPAKLIQTEDLQEHFKEFDPEKPDKPKGCLPFRSSKFADWYMYGLHDTAYLASKGQARRYHYTREEVATSNDDELNRAIHEIDFGTVAPIQALEQAIAERKTFAECLRSGIVPIQQARNYKLAWNAILESMTYRNDRETHTPKFDPKTGEIIEE